MTRPTYPSPDGVPTPMPTPNPPPPRHGAFVEPCRLTIESGPDQGRSVRSWLAYDPARPFEAKLTMDFGVDMVEWLFARDLLRKGLDGIAGDGDVRIAPLGDAHVMVMLNTSHGPFPMSVARSVVARWVQRSYELVPPGAERVDVDAWLDRLGVAR